MKDYIVSARKYRPTSFDTVVGQTALITTLKNAVKNGKLAHAYLFCGPRGVGKTTCARIFAKAINCLHPTENGEACNQCESCTAFNEQRSYNVFELDAASNNSVENIKTLMEQTRIPPQVGKYKVFIIDEVHMLSTAAFNAFLKTLEEPPAHVIFILATTEKHKILPTILSRCQIYDFERMTTNNIVNHLKKVAQKEGITYEEEALDMIAEKADGGMRDALSVFDQVVSFCQGNVTYNKVIEDLNVLDADYYFKIVDLSITNKVSDIMLLLNSIIAKGFAGGQLIMGLASHIRNVLMAKDIQTLPLLEVSEQQKQKYGEQAKKCSTTFLYQALKLLNQCDINYKQSSNKRLLVELTLIQIAQITQPDDATAGVGHSPKRLKSLFQKLAPAKGNESTQHTKGLETNKVSQANAPRVSISQQQKPKVATVVSGETTPKKTRLKLSNIGATFGTLRSSNRQSEIANNIPQQTITQNVVFSNEELQLQWRVMCNRMPQEMIGLAQRMQNISPKITTFPQVEVVIENDILLRQLQDIKGKIQATLRMLLHHDKIELCLRLAEAKEVTKIYSKREIFEMLKQDNPQISKLCDNLKLELC